MPSLNWVGKEAVINHDKEVPFKLLRKVKSVSVGENSQNLIIHGDNLEALKALMPYYGGEIKCIYIDPPYNTGNEKWVYNDRVNSPKIRKWLKKEVGIDDLTRHDKWLCMMYPRLKLLRDLLSENGVIFISIDDNEQGHLKILMDEIFGEDKTDVMIWRKSGVGRDGKMKNTTTFRKDHEYVLVGFKSDKKLNKLKEKPQFQGKVENPDKDPRGDWLSGSISRADYASNEKSGNYYTVISPTGNKIKRQFEIEENEFKKLDKDKRIYWGLDGNNVPRVKIFVNEFRYITPYSLILNFGTTSEGKREISEIFGTEKFPNPKQTNLIKMLVQISTGADDIILDSFAGSGTTGHAVLNLNKEDGGNRKFIMVEMEDKVAKDITAERVKRAIKKYGYKDGFEYCELGKPLFNEDGQIEEKCSFDQLATYIYFTETNTNLDKKVILGNSIGEYNGTKYYLLFKEKRNNILDKGFLSKLPKGNSRKVIYADKCLIDDKILEKYNIQFKQIPYEVKVY